MLYLYRISQTKMKGYNTYDSAVVCAANESEARRMHPCGDPPDPYAPAFGLDEDGYTHRTDWATFPADVNVEYLGQAASGTLPGVICASYNAG